MNLGFPSQVAVRLARIHFRPVDDFINQSAGSIGIGFDCHQQLVHLHSFQRVCVSLQALDSLDITQAQFGYSIVRS